MKQPNLFCLWLTLSTCSAAHAELCPNPQSADMGQITIQQQKVNRPMCIMGRLQANHAQFQSLNVRGQARFTHTQVRSVCRIQGSMDAMDSHWAQPVMFQGQRAAFRHSSLPGITIKSAQSPAILILRDHTQVRGTVRFIGMPGCIDRDATSRIEGHIHNAHSCKTH